MFENLTDRLGGVMKKLRGAGRLTEENIEEALREVRMSLLEADVALPVVRAFIEQVRARAVGAEVIGTLTPGQALIRVVRDELVTMMGEANERLNLAAEPPAVVLMAGLQGSGKTTSLAKLAKRLHEKEKKDVLVVSCDVYRPAAIDQLEILAREVGVEFFPSKGIGDPRQIATKALEHARKKFKDVLLVDTAGRLHIDELMMKELADLHGLLKPVETLFVVDSMMGQDAVATAKVFGDTLPLTGVILTKTDGDARGGAALSVRQVTGKPIKFIGVGEKVGALEPFHPDRMASRILGMGDVLSLIEEVEQKVDHEKVDAFARKMKEGKEFDLQDFRDQLAQMQSMGGIGGLMDKMPGMGDLKDKARKTDMGDREFRKFAAIIDSMTRKERRFPALLKASQKRRISKGSGTEVADINRLLRQFEQMQKMMKKFSKKGMMNKMMQGLKGRLPPGMSM
jgi:signal recognition particle subunit SRP54